MKYYQDELAATTSAGLLNIPAIIFGPMCSPYTQYPIFIPEAEGGTMVIIDNPAYFRRDLPKYVPQCFVVSFETTRWFNFTPKQDPIQVLNENFPIEKLQTMIDK